MKVSEYLEKLPIGEIVTNKRLLAALKRKGLIFDYSAHGYLCSCPIYYNEEYNGRVEKYSRMIHLFPSGNAPREYRVCPDGEKFLSCHVSTNYECSEVDDIYGYDGGVIEYNGSYFTTQYLDGCFCPYLVKCDSKGHYNRRRKMCVWSNVI